MSETMSVVVELDRATQIEVLTDLQIDTNLNEKRIFTNINQNIDEWLFAGPYYSNIRLLSFSFGIKYVNSRYEKDIWLVLDKPIHPNLIASPKLFVLSYDIGILNPRPENLDISGPRHSSNTPLSNDLVPTQLEENFPDHDYALYGWRTYPDEAMSNPLIQIIFSTEIVRRRLRWPFPYGVSSSHSGPETTLATSTLAQTTPDVKLLKTPRTEAPVYASFHVATPAVQANLTPTRIATTVLTLAIPPNPAIEVKRVEAFPYGPVSNVHEVVSPATQIDAELKKITQNIYILPLWIQSPSTSIITHVFPKNHTSTLLNLNRGQYLLYEPLLKHYNDHTNIALKQAIFLGRWAIPENLLTGPASLPSELHGLVITIVSEAGRQAVGNLADISIVLTKPLHPNTDRIQLLSTFFYETNAVNKPNAGHLYAPSSSSFSGTPNFWNPFEYVADARFVFSSTTPPLVLDDQIEGECHIYTWSMSVNITTALYAILDSLTSTSFESDLSPRAFLEFFSIYETSELSQALSTAGPETTLATSTLAQTTPDVKLLKTPRTEAPVYASLHVATPTVQANLTPTRFALKYVIFETPPNPAIKGAAAAPFQHGSVFASAAVTNPAMEGAAAAPFQYGSVFASAAVTNPAMEGAAAAPFQHGSVFASAAVTNPAMEGAAAAPFQYGSVFASAAVTNPAMEGAAAAPFQYGSVFASAAVTNPAMEGAAAAPFQYGSVFASAAVTNPATAWVITRIDKTLDSLSFNLFSPQVNTETFITRPLQMSQSLDMTEVSIAHTNFRKMAPRFISPHTVISSSISFAANVGGSATGFSLQKLSLDIQAPFVLTTIVPGILWPIIDLLTKLRLLLSIYERAPKLRNILTGLFNILEETLIEPLLELNRWANLDHASPSLLNGMGIRLGISRPWLLHGEYIAFGNERPNIKTFDQGPFYDRLRQLEDFIPMPSSDFKRLLKARRYRIYGDTSRGALAKVLEELFGQGKWKAEEAPDSVKITVDCDTFWYNLIHKELEELLIPKTASVSYYWSRVHGDLEVSIEAMFTPASVLFGKDIAMLDWRGPYLKVFATDPFPAAVLAAQVHVIDPELKFVAAQVTGDHVAEVAVLPLRNTTVKLNLESSEIGVPRAAITKSNM